MDEQTEKTFEQEEFNTSQELTFSLPEFEGSLDLLLFLVKKEEKDIRDIQISKIADEFVNYVKKMQRLDVSIASDFMVMASTLMVLKSKALLTEDEAAQQEVKEAKEKLVQQIEEYERVKNIVALLEEKQKKADQLYRVKVKRDGQIKKRSVEELPDKLFLAFKSAYDELKLREKIYKVSGEQYSISERIGWLKELLNREKRVSVNELFSIARDKIDLIVSFLAVLELVKLSFADIDFFGGITVVLL
ncbi:MAG TPA: segregation/condensation protein A [Thermotogota bacterium]|nr:segregation/condensation protein A [Thermotogota bacterium]HRW34425.1 segregation/condensation protein A [Thermotogota bacterium]